MKKESGQLKLKLTRSFALMRLSSFQQQKEFTLFLDIPAIMPVGPQKKKTYSNVSYKPIAENQFPTAHILLLLLNQTYNRTPYYQTGKVKTMLQTL